MVPDCRDFDKDSKKYLFAILGFFYIFLGIYKVFSQKIAKRTKLDNTFGSLVLQKTPWKDLGLTLWPLAGKQRRGAAWPAGSGGSGRRRRGARGGGARGGRKLPRGVLG